MLVGQRRQAPVEWLVESRVQNRAGRDRLDQATSVERRPLKNRSRPRAGCRKAGR
jgi:hypothetical protein